MRYKFVLAIVWLLASIGSASPQEKAAALPQEKFVGEWIGDNEDGLGRIFTRFIVSKKDNDWSIKAWFNPGGGPGVAGIEMKTVTLSLLGDDPNSKSRPYGFATWEMNGEKKGGMTIHVSLRSEKEKLVVETFTILKDTPGVNRRDLEKFKKK